MEHVLNQKHDVIELDYTFDHNVLCAAYEKVFPDLNEIYLGYNKYIYRDGKYIADEYYENSIFGELITAIEHDYIVHTVSVHCLRPRQCFTWHSDNVKSIHVCISGNKGAIYAFENNIYYTMEDGKVYEFNSLVPHCVVNGSSTEIRANLLLHVTKK